MQLYTRRRRRKSRVWLNAIMNPGVNELSTKILALNRAERRGLESRRSPWISENPSRVSIMNAFSLRMIERMWNEMLKNYFRRRLNDMWLKILERGEGAGVISKDFSSRFHNFRNYFVHVFWQLWNTGKFLWILKQFSCWKVNKILTLIN